MDTNIIEKYAEDIFGYCIKRIGNIEDARDLSQEILCEILASMKSSEIRDINSWVWKIAHNRYARFIGTKQTQCISIDDSGILDTLADETELYESNSVELSAAFAAVHAIAQSHRDILVDYYVNRFTYEQIADKYCLPVGTVKTRLFYGKQKLRERWKQKMDSKKIYGKIVWFPCGNGNVNTSYIDRQISRAIVSACYEKYLTVEDISNVTGIPCMYIEDELPTLIYGEIVTEKGGKYISNIIVHSEALTKSIEQLLLSQVQHFTDVTVGVLEKHMKTIREIGFCGCDFPDSKLWWNIIPIVWREACNQARSMNGKLERGDFPPRRDGGKGWIFANISPDGKHRYFSGCNGYYMDNCKFQYFWCGKYFCDELNTLLRYLENKKLTSADFVENGFDELTAANCIKCGLAYKTDGVIRWNIPIFTEKQYAQLESVTADTARPLAELLYPSVEKIYDLMKAEIPKHLHPQIKGIFGAELNSVIAMICDVMEEKGLLEKPENEYFASQVIMTLR